MQQLVLNLYGAPGSGKSTGAAYIFSKLKQQGISCELITEFAKDLVWDNSYSLNNQIYVFGEQYHRMERLRGKVDVIITDSPLPLSLIYHSIKNEDVKKLFEQLVIAATNSFDNLNWFIIRDKPYVQTGRLQTETESDAISNVIRDMLNLDKLKDSYLEAKGNQEGYDMIVRYVKEDTVTRVVNNSTNNITRIIS